MRKYAEDYRKNMRNRTRRGRFMGFCVVEFLVKTIQARVQSVATPEAAAQIDRRESRHVFAGVENRCSLSDLRTNLTSNFAKDVARANQSIRIESFSLLIVPQ